MNSNSELYDCTTEITYWLLTNDILVNTSKTELLNISKVLVTFPTLSIDGIIIKPSESVQNLSVLIDNLINVMRSRSFTRWLILHGICCLTAYED